MCKATILMVEDDAILAMDLQRMISQQGYTVLAPLASGEEAITFLLDNQVDLVLMDIELAGDINGIRTAEILHQTSDVPIVFLTGFSHDPLLEQAKIAAPYGYLIKPVPERELAATLEMALHRHSLDRQLQKSRLELKKSEEKYRQLVENSPLGIFRTTLAGRVLAVNAEMARIVGCVSPEEAIADFTDLADQFYVDPQRRQQLITQLKAEGAVQHFEFEGRKKNGETLWISMNARLTPTDAANGHSGEMVIDGFAIDITERKQAEEENRRFKTIADNAVYGMAIADLEGNLQYVNRFLANIHGYEPEQLLGKHLSLFHSQDQMEAVDRLNATMMQEGYFATTTVWHRHQDGRVFPMLMSGNLIKDDYGSPQYMAVSALDITAHHLAQEALRESEERFRSYFNLPLIGFAITSLEKGWIEVNERLCEILGYAREELITLTWTAITHPEDVERDVAQFNLILEGVSEDYSLEKRFIRKDGSVIHGSISVCCVRKPDRTINYFVALVQDITDRKQAEIALRQSEEKFRLLVNTAPFGIQLTDLEGKIVYSNPAHHRIQGYGPNKLIGMHIWNLMANDSHRAKAREYYQTIIRNKTEPTVYFSRDRTKDGREIDVRVIWDYVHNDQGQVDGIISILEDITELKRSEEEKRVLTAQLQQAQKMEAIGTLAGGIAHDFNNILGAIVGYAEMIRDDFPVGSPGIHNINQVLKASFRAKDLVKQILTFSRQVEGQKNPIQPALIIKEAITLLRSSLPTTITINQDIAADVGMVLADPIQIHQIVMNLATNAFHAMEAKGGTLTISLRNTILCQDDLATEPDLQPGTFVQLSIRDSGEGISPEIREKIFDPFFTTKEVGKGTGLGLSMVYSIVKNSGGSIACDSRVGEGTEFRILLPTVEGHSGEENGSTDLIAHGKGHILLIDDEEMLVEFGQIMLERLGYQVTVHTSSLKALATLQSDPHDFDAVITDQTMPGMTGLDLARRMLQIRPELPIILCTGYSKLVDEAEAKAYGIKGFAMKPLTQKEIAALLREVLSEAARTTPGKEDGSC